MKNLRVIFLSVFFALMAYAISAQNTAGFTTSITGSENPEAVLIQLSGLDGERTQVHITNAKGFTAYREFIWNENNYGANFLMEGMPHGDYLVRIDNNSGQVLRAFNYDGEGIHLLGAEAPGSDETGKLIARFDPVKKAPELEVRVANLKLRPFSFYLVRLNGAKFYSEELRGEFAYAKRFNLKGLEEGDYYIFVRAGETAVWQNIGYEEGAIRLKQKFSRGNVAEEPPEVQVVALQD